jgi:hypothetical protein
MVPKPNSQISVYSVSRPYVFFHANVAISDNNGLSVFQLSFGFLGTRSTTITTNVLLNAHGPGATPYTFEYSLNQENELFPIYNIQTSVPEGIAANVATTYTYYSIPQPPAP